MNVIDARRLTGPNLLSRQPLVIVELSFDETESLSVIRDAYLAELGRLRVALGWPADVGSLVVRPHRGGAVIGYEAPIDVMLAATEMSEWAIASTASRTGTWPEDIEKISFEEKVAEVTTLLERDRSPRLLALQAAASQRNLPFLWDDEHVSIGLGNRCGIWPRNGLPDPATIEWDRLDTIPVAMITGTNGKTTSTRLLARIVREAGFTVGCTSSDAISIGSDVIDSGDWTGPAAARTVLRNQLVTFAVLETARGGILRRGLAIEHCDAALITNVSEDHSGYGIDDLDAMAQVKAVVGHAATKAVVLNPRDARLAALRFEAPVLPFATESPVPIAEIPITFGGAATYNVENALGVVAMARALGLPEDAIARGLRGFSPAENPRRGQLATRHGVKVMLDFAHNADGVRGVMELVAKLRDPSSRLFVVAGAAGDRQDPEILAMCAEIAKASPHRIFVRELLDYLRGRQPGEVSKLIATALPSAHVVTSEVEALRQAFEAARAGDFIVVLVHLDYEPVQAFLASA